MIADRTLDCAGAWRSVNPDVLSTQATLALRVSSNTYVVLATML
jgi:hypothetical protein